MKKTLLCAGLFLGSLLTVNAQTVLFEDSFETYENFAIADVGDWTLIDVDGKTVYGFNGVTFPNSGVAKAFIVFNATATVDPLEPTEASDWTARTGDKHMVSFAASSGSNNDWLISPPITLGASANVLSFWAKSCDSEYGAEKFKVGISSGATTTDVTLLSTGVITTPSDATWAEYTYTVPASFDGQEVYFSINCVSPDQFGFAVDDFKVTTGTLSTENFFKSNFAVYPNPATSVLNITSNANAAINAASITDINGRTVKTVSLNAVSEAQINISDLTAGVYFLNVTSDAGTGTSKIVKK